MKSTFRAARKRQERATRKAVRQVLARSRALLAPPKRRKAKPKIARPATGTARIETRSFTCAAGRRSYRLCVPALGRRKPRGLILMLHGCAQDAEDFARGTQMDRHATAEGLLVAYPTQSKTANAHGCWNWFLPAHQGAGQGEPAILAGLTRALVAEFDLARRPVFLAGISAGGAMAAVLAATNPTLYDAVGIHSGLATGSAHNAASALAAMRGNHALPAQAAKGTTPRCILFQGSADHTVAATNAERLLAAAVPAALPRRTVEGSAGGRRYRRTLVTRGVMVVAESWLIEGAGHAWSGGDGRGSYSDPRGPDASAEMLRFFLES